MVSNDSVQLSAAASLSFEVPESKMAAAGSRSGWLGPFRRVHLRDGARGGRRWNPRPSVGARPSSWSGWPSHRVPNSDHSQALVQEVLELSLEHRADSP